MWTITSKRITKPTSYLKLQDPKFPEELDKGYLDQLHKVYHNCIHPTQFLPQLFDEISAPLILQTGTYITEIMTEITSFLPSNAVSFSQHSRHVLLLGEV
eukprot:Phypoly_transcript_15069.p1 GENE.Phypoly_transcript_15069~~Phypoly_transcript_15069.p1  ORF type:complete len:100 (+),score=9.18 Phypoly_transcript_15069:529-828(+)